MLVFLAHRPKCIAWIFISLFCIELIITPVAASATGTHYSNYMTSVYGEYAWLRYMNKKYGDGARKKANNKIYKSKANKEKEVHKVGKKFSIAAPFTGGPTQPEMQAFSSVSNANMVDLFSGDFSYNIPLLDVGGYPVNLGYRSGISMDQEASWVGLGWNVNPGTITRNMRGLPDDFNGANDSIRKVTNIRQNKTIGVNTGADIEIVGLPLSVGASVGIFHNNYRGWGLEYALNASISASMGSSGGLTAGLSLSNSTQEGVTVTPSLSARLSENTRNERDAISGSLSLSLPYNTRSGLKDLQVSAGVRQTSIDGANQQTLGSFSSVISFSSPSYTPTISMPFTNRHFSFTGRLGIETKVVSPSFFISGYVSKQFLPIEDTLLALPSYGYLYSQDGARNRSALLDFNREKELPYREKPPVPHIAVPSYTYDAFSITGEGTGGMFRAYRGDIGFVYDHVIRTKDESDRVSVDIAIADLVHAGVDLGITRSFTQNGPWLSQNTMAPVIDFRKNETAYEAVYFRNPGEKSINDKTFYNTLGADDVVTIGLYQASRSSSVIQTTNELWRYRDKKPVGSSPLNKRNAVKQQRDKRTQVISYLTAKEAETGALDRYIDNHLVNQFDNVACTPPDFDKTFGNGSGLIAQYYPSRTQPLIPFVRKDPVIDFQDWSKGAPNGVVAYLPNGDSTNFPADNFYIQWKGLVKAPVTGTYTFYTRSDDGIRMWINDVLFIDKWIERPAPAIGDSFSVNLMAEQFYNIKVEYFEFKSPALVTLAWKRPDMLPGQRQIVPAVCLYPVPIDSFPIANYLVKEKRVNGFRKKNHISEVTVLNNDGRRYVYGIPVYNLKQKETTFAVNGKDSGNRETGLVTYAHGIDNTALNNRQGKDWYYSSEEIPAYAHSFLLTGILSADYADITGNGISDDDIGDAVKFNYSKICGIGNPYQWRAPSVERGATFNEGLRTDYRDDKGNYVYGEKELWYMHSIESKTMIATFVLENRDDLYTLNEKGVKTGNAASKRLKEINLYSKADFTRLGTKARAIKTVHFEYGYNLCPGINGPGTGKLTLKKVWFTYNGNSKGKQNPYVFNYNAKNPSYNIKSYDRWGNYKDPLQNPGSMADKVITNAEYPYALQDSTQAAANAAAWSLDSIHLPSGGSIKVQYESDDYAYVQNKRAMQMCKIVGFSNSKTLSADPFKLYKRLAEGLFEDRLYVFIKVPKPVTDPQQVYQQYLQGVSKFYFRLHIKMPADAYGNGHEYVPCYATLAAENSYGLLNANTIWVKLAGISFKGDGSGNYSPLAKAALQFLRLNLPSKAYPGSDVGDNMDLENAVKMLASLSDNIKELMNSFDGMARNKEVACTIDTARSYVRLANPYYKKLGGGHRVKRITIYDNWNKMTNQRAAMYGQEYMYTLRKEIHGVKIIISSGVASYEPGLGGEENPFREPIEYVEQIAPLGPVTLGYSEEPLGESFFPSAGVGYSCVRVRTINYQKKKSANGYEETQFYTAYDFPTYTDRTLIDDDTKKRFKPGLTNFLKINTRHYLTLSQGFKVEINDMHGKLRSKASYAETDPEHPISYSENIYRVEEPKADHKRLLNTVMVISPDGVIDTAALIGKEVELMVDMREQQTITNGRNINLNTELFTFSFPPFFMIPSFLGPGQREENRFRSVATTKIIQRYGILDSAIQIDKGSKITTKDMLYDSETGDVLLTRTQNEFNDYVYNFIYPSHWAYDGMGLAYKNINVTLNNITMRDGKITGGLNTPESELFSSGDEILVAGRLITTDVAGCVDSFSSFHGYDKIWAVDRSLLYGGPSSIYFIDRSGKAYSGNGINLKIIRSGRRNILASVGTVTALDSLIRKNPVTGQYELVINTSSKIIAASAAAFREFWKVEDIKKRGRTDICLPNWQSTGQVRCLQVNGVNTGYQEIEEEDTNPKSGSLGNKRWSFFGLNCMECARPASWQYTDSFRCSRDSLGYFTGYREREQVDTVSCSKTSGMSRWIVTAINCSLCPKPAVWYATGNIRCVKDNNGNNTGYYEREERDTVSCSNSYNSTRWILAAMDCMNCQRPSKWVATDSVRCQKIDPHPGAPNTGNQERLEIDTAFCHHPYNYERWVNIGPNPSACPTCNTSNCTGNNKKCIGGRCETGVLSCYSSVEWRGNSWRNCYRYRFSDGSWSMYQTCEIKTFPCADIEESSIQLPVRNDSSDIRSIAATVQQTQKIVVFNPTIRNPQQDMHWQPVENVNDQLYRRELPKDKYNLYKQQ